MPEIHHTLKSSILGNERSIWARVPEKTKAKLNLLIILDAELYRNRVQAPGILEELFDNGTLSDILVVYVSYANMDTRWIECPCYPPFASFIAHEVQPWIESNYPSVIGARERVIAGLSYTGLAASFVALSHDGLFTKVISQSGSYWSNDCWLSNQLDHIKLKNPPAFFLDVGDKETQEYVWHKEDVIQTKSQVAGVEHFREKLLKNGYAVRYDTFPGGHSAEAWATSLPNALRWAFSGAAT